MNDQISNNGVIVKEVMDYASKMLEKMTKAPTNAYDVEIAKINAVRGVVGGMVFSLGLFGSMTAILYFASKSAAE